VGSRRVNPRQGARALAIGRAVFGAALLIVPERVAKGWLGEYAERPAVHALVRSIGVRDVVLGMIALHTLDHPEVGPRWQATCAVVDTVDLLATGAARKDLPAAGVAGTALVAGGAAAAGFYFSRALTQSASAPS
jgi:hypothetical protein